MRPLRLLLPILAVAIVAAACQPGAAASPTSAATATATAAATTPASPTPAASATPVATTAAPTDSPSPSPEPTSPYGELETRAEGVLTVGTNLPNPPFFIGTDINVANPEGFEVELADEIAKRLGIETVKWVDFPFNGIVTGAPCPCDFFLGGVTAYEDRKKVVDFSSTYFKSTQGVVVVQGLNVPDRAAARDLLYGVQKDSSGQFFLSNDLKPTKEPRVYDSTTDVINALRAGQIDAMMNDMYIALETTSKDKSLAIAGQFETGEEFGAVLPKGSPNTKVVSAVIDELKAEGFFEPLLKKYFPEQVQIPVLK